MEVTYNLSMLFDESEFDVKKGCDRYGSKEAFFSILHGFTIDTAKIIGAIRNESSENLDLYIINLSLWTDRLRGMLAGIGAINLAWKVQSIKQFLDKERLSEFLLKLEEALTEVDKLRNRIIYAEKKVESAEPDKQENSEVIKNEPGEQRKRRIPRLSDFEKLLMLIENFELDSAAKTTITIMRHSYTPGIDDTLASVYKALGSFDYSKAIEDARSLLNYVIAEAVEKKVILAIDDVPSVLRTIEAMLKDTYRVYCMPDYDSAVKFLTNNSVDLILLDIEMPGIDGFSMIQLFRSIPEYEQTPIIFLTSHASDEHIKKAVNLGARDFIKKPVDLRVLLNKLEHALKGNYSI